MCAEVVRCLGDRSSSHPCLTLYVRVSRVYISLQGTYYGFRTRGFGHCSFHFHGTTGLGANMSQAGLMGRGPSKDLS